MEGNDWYNRTGYTDYRNHYRGDDRPLDQNVFGEKDAEDSYRGAYRLDTSSDHRNVSTYDWNEGGMHRTGGNRGMRGSQQHMPYQQNRQHDYERSWSGSYPNDRDEGYYRNERHTHWDEQYRPTSGGYNTRFGGSGYSNFNEEYAPDHYRANRNENYGNMAGSLSWGYDGGNNSNPDFNRRYDPLSGRIRNQHGSYDDQHRGGYNDYSDQNRY